MTLKNPQKKKSTAAAGVGVVPGAESQVNEYEKTGCSVYLIHKLELHTKKLGKLVYII